jgi:hypothetical protein
VQQERDLFMAQLAIDARREEIRRLERLERDEEESLRTKEAEINLFRDQFRSFIEHDTKETLEARAVADQKMKRRLEVAAQLKKVFVLNSGLRNDIAHLEDKLEDWSVYKDFLEKLTPPEWRQTHPMPERYFKSPDQLVGLMRGMESHNMFLVGHCQDAEHVLERYRTKFNDIMDRREGIMEIMRERRDERQVALDEQLAKNEAYKAVGEFRYGNELGEAEMAELQTEILAFHAELGFEATRSVQTVVMLTRIENVMVELTDKLEQIDIRVLKDLAQEKDLVRRDQERTEKNERDKREQEEKAQHAIQLAMMPIKRRSGRPAIRRMLPLKCEPREKREEAMRQRQTRAAADANLLYGDLWD